MQFTDTDVRTTHEVRAYVTITDAEVMYDDALKFTGRKTEAVRIPFRPERAQFAWRWSPDLDEWVLTGLSVFGPQIKKDGTDGLKTRSVGFIRRGEVSGDTPVSLLNYANSIRPTSKVVQS